MIAGVVDTGDKCIAGDKGTSEQDVWDVHGRVFSWQFELNFLLPCPTSAAGDVAILV